MWYPIAFASRTLGKSKRNYCQLEKETSTVFACKKLHHYIYGQQFLIENDHKLLQSIFKEPFNKTPPILQRFMLYLQRYDFKIQFIPGKQVIVADALSRSALPDTTTELTNAEL